MTRQEALSNFVNNIERERIRLGFTQKEMAEKLNYSLSGYKKMIGGETSKIDVYLSYLLYDLTGKFVFEFFGDQSPYADTVSKLRDLSPSQYAFIDAIIDFERDFKNNNPCNHEDYITVMVPTGNVEDGMIWDSVNFEKVNIAPYRKKFGNQINCGIRINSNHFSPVYHKNDILLVCKRAPRDGDTGIFINKETGLAYLRRFRQTNPTILEPLNEQGVAIEIDSYDSEEINRWIKFGYVITKVRG